MQRPILGHALKERQHGKRGTKYGPFIGSAKKERAQLNMSRMRGVGDNEWVWPCDVPFTSCLEGRALMRVYVALKHGQSGLRGVGMTTRHCCTYWYIVKQYCGQWVSRSGGTQDWIYVVYMYSPIFKVPCHKEFLMFRNLIFCSQFYHLVRLSSAFSNPICFLNTSF